jgi:hypothetical protein
MTPLPTKAQMITVVVNRYDRTLLPIEPTMDELTGQLMPISDTDVKGYLQQFQRRDRQLLYPFVTSLTDAELKQLDDVIQNQLVRPMRADWIAAALGDMTELERERAAVKTSKDGNKAAPTSEDVDVLYRPVQVQVQMDPEGSFVENVTISKWELDPETNKPVQVELKTEDVQ